MPAVEILLNTRNISELIEKGEISEIKEALEKSLAPGSQTFEQSLFKLFMEGRITQEEALTNADSATNMLWLINQATAGELSLSGATPSQATTGRRKERETSLRRRRQLQRLQDRRECLTGQCSRSPGSSSPAGRSRPKTAAARRSWPSASCGSVSNASPWNSAG